MSQLCFFHFKCIAVDAKRLKMCIYLHYICRKASVLLMRNIWMVLVLIVVGAHRKITLPLH